jgi:hypothetical protein
LMVAGASFMHCNHLPYPGLCWVGAGSVVEKLRAACLR